MNYYSNLTRGISGCTTHCCCCEQPVFKNLLNLKDNPRFEFRKHAREFCRINNLTDVKFSKHNKSAIAVLNKPCAHREKQYIRIEWFTMD